MGSIPVPCAAFIYLFIFLLPKYSLNPVRKKIKTKLTEPKGKKKKKKRRGRTEDRIVKKKKKEELKIEPKKKKGGGKN